MSPRPMLASLAAFLGAGLRPPTPLARAIVIVLAAKLVAVTFMAVFFLFLANHESAVNAAAVGHLLGPPAP